MTETGMSLGTPTYMSPEQAMGEREITARSDVYALGCVTYEMLIGDPPFTGPHRAGDRRQGDDRAAAPASAGSGAASRPQVEAAVLTALEKLPADRFATAGGVRRRRWTVAADAAAGAGAVSAGPASDAPARRRASPRSTSPAPRAARPSPAAGSGARAPRRASPSCSGPFATRPSTTPASRPTDGPSSTARRRRPAPPMCSSSAPTIRADPSRPHRNPPARRVVERRAGRPGPRGIPASPAVPGHPGARPLGGGAPREVLDSVREADWSPDGTELAIIHDVGGRDRLEFPIGKVLYEASGYLSDPRVSPDGRHVAFAEHPFRWDDRGTVKIVDRRGQAGGRHPGLPGHRRAGVAAPRRRAAVFGVRQQQRVCRSWLDARRTAAGRGDRRRASSRRRMSPGAGRSS